MRTTLGAAGVALALAAALAPLPAEARTKRFRPLDFTAADTSSDHSRSPIALAARSGNADFTARLGLPTGAAVTAVRMYTSGVGDLRSVYLEKRRAGYASIMASVSENVPHLNLTTPMLSDGDIVYLPPVSVVEPGYLYAVRVQCAPGTAVWGVEVDYDP